MTLNAHSPLRASGRCQSPSCRGGRCNGLIGLDRRAFDRMMPLHVIVSTEGRILRAGPSLQKLCGPQRIVGRAFLDHFDFRQPRDVESIRDLMKAPETPLRLSLRDGERTALKGQAVSLECGRAVLIDMCFGVSITEAARRFSLTPSDFGGTDLGIELLFLAEAHAAALSEMRRSAERQKWERERVEREAGLDCLTGAHNRRALERRLAECTAMGVPFALVQLDLDAFRSINAQHSYATGDAVLQAVAERLRSATRDGDMIARIGGDEFVVFVESPKAVPNTLDLSERIVSALGPPLRVGGQSFEIRASIGVVAVPAAEDRSTEACLHAADAAMIAAKHQGSGGPVIRQIDPAEVTPPPAMDGPLREVDRRSPSSHSRAG